VEGLTCHMNVSTQTLGAMEDRHLHRLRPPITGSARDPNLIHSQKHSAHVKVCRLETYRARETDPHLDTKFMSICHWYLLKSSLP